MSEDKPKNEPKLSPGDAAASPHKLPDALGKVETPPEPEVDVAGESQEKEAPAEPTHEHVGQTTQDTRTRRRNR